MPCTGRAQCAVRRVVGWPAPLRSIKSFDSTMLEVDAVAAFKARRRLPSVKQGLQVALEPPRPGAMTLAVTDELWRFDAPERHGMGENGGGADGTTRGLFKRLFQVTGPIMSALMVQRVSREAAWEIVEKVRAGLSALVPFSMSITIWRTRGGANLSLKSAPSCLSPVGRHVTCLPEEREQETLRCLCSGLDTSQPIIFSSRNIQTYLATQQRQAGASGQSLDPIGWECDQWPAGTCTDMAQLFQPMTVSQQVSGQLILLMREVNQSALWIVQRASAICRSKPAANQRSNQWLRRLARMTTALIIGDLFLLASKCVFAW